MNEDVDGFLMHYGIKGMKWGVTTKDSGPAKSSKELTKLAREGKNRLADDAAEYRVNQMFGLNKTNSKNLSDKDRVISKGSELYRTTKNSNKELQETTYFSTNKKDRETYRGVMGSLTTLRGASRNYTPTYESTVLATKNLKLPSEKKRFDAYVELMDTPSIPVGLFKNKKEITGREYLRRTGAGRDVRKLDSIALGEKYYDTFLADQGAKTPINSAYFNNLKKKGYNALSDDNDRGVVSNDPIIVLDTTTSTKVVYTKRLSNDEINRSLAFLTPPKNKKTGV